MPCSCMRPPICDICNRDFNPDKEGGLLDFKETEEGREFDRRVDEEGIVGHPPDSGWFCGEHCSAAEKLVHLTYGEEVNRLMKGA